jgi:hypothetical protein
MVAAMLMTDTSPCESCDWENWVRRRRCRNCGADLVMHPEPEIDHEVRLDAADGAAYDRAIGLRGGR